jgi:hypothetical protein
MDPLTIALMGGAAVGGLVSGSQGRGQAEENLSFQKWLANEEMRLAKASHTDAMGNTVRYDPALNEWTTDLSQSQRALSKAGEHEQQLSLTEDAARNRQIRERAFQRGMGANDNYNDLNAQFRYGSNPSEGSIENQIADSLLRGRRSGGGNADTTRQFIRQRGNLPVVSGSAVDPEGSEVSQISKAILQARQGAVGEHGQRQQQRMQLLPAMQSAAAMSDAGAGGNVQFPDFNKLFDAEGGMSKGLIGAAEAGGKGIQGGYNSLIKATHDEFPSVSDTAKMISALRGGKSTTTAANNNSIWDNAGVGGVGDYGF